MHSPGNAAPKRRRSGGRRRPRLRTLVTVATALAVVVTGGVVLREHQDGRDITTAAEFATVPAAAAGLTATRVLSRSVTLTWTASPDKLGLRGYLVSRDGTVVGTVATTTFTDLTVTPATTYRYQVRAAGGGNTASVATAPLTVTTRGKRPAAPGALTAQAVSSTHVHLSWSKVAGPAAVRYQIFRNRKRIGTSAATSFDDPHVRPATKYTYAVRARYGRGMVGLGSKIVSVTTPAKDAPQGRTPPGAPGSPGGPPGSGSPDPAGFPGAGNTGYANAPGYPGHLKNCNNEAIRSGTTYEYCYFPGGLSVGTGSEHPSNIKFIGCLFASNAVDNANVDDYGNNIVFSYDSFGPSAALTESEQLSPGSTPVANNQGYQYGINQGSSGALTIDHADFWGFAEAVQFGSSDSASPVVISNSWIHNARDPANVDHTDGILENYGGLSYMVFDHNTIVGDGNTNALALQGGTPYGHVSITNNYFSGYGYMVNSGSDTHSTDMTFTGNVWGTDIKPYYGPLYGDAMYTTPGLGGVWANNTIDVRDGTTWMAKGNNGLFWWPTDGNPSSSSQIIGHKTDYRGP